MDYPFTAIPKWFFPLVRELSEAELRIMMVVWDQTTGWQVDANTFAYTFLQHHTGMTSRTAIFKALTSLENRGMIKREPKRINGQKIQIYPQSPILPVEVVTLEDSRVTLEDSESPLRRLTESSKKTHRKNNKKESFIETTTWEKFTPDQEEGAQILVVVGLDQDISRHLIVTAWKNGRDLEYIKQVVGYVNSVAAKNPEGYIRSLIERNAGRIPVSQAAQGPGIRQKVISPTRYHYYDDGGEELIQHTGERRDCPICQEVENAQV